VVDTAPAAIRHQDALPMTAFPQMRSWLEAGWCRAAVVERVVLYRPCGVPSSREVP
jgi:hypothetical protein